MKLKRRGVERVEDVVKKGERWIGQRRGREMFEKAVESGVVVRWWRAGCGEAGMIHVGT